MRIPGRDLAALDVRTAHEPEHFTLEGDEPARAQALAVESPRDVQQIEMRFFVARKQADG